jgi:hypothetical protein
MIALIAVIIIICIITLMEPSNGYAFACGRGKCICRSIPDSPYITIDCRRTDLRSTPKLKAVEKRLAAVILMEGTPYCLQGSRRDRDHLIDCGVQKKVTTVRK